MAIEYLAHVDQVKAQTYIDKYLLADLKRVDYEVACYNAMKSPTPQDLERLEMVVEEFNSDRKYNAVGKYDNKKDLVDGWIATRKVLQIKLTQHHYNQQYCISLNCAFVAWNDYYRRNKDAFPEHDEYYKAISTFCALVYDGIMRGDYRKDMLYNHRSNPYSRYLIAGRANKSLPQNGFPTIEDAAFALTRITHIYQIKHRTQSSPRIVMWCLGKLICERYSFDAIFANVIFYANALENGKISDLWGWNRQHTITRHISWCAYEDRRRCTKLQIDCYSSVNCPFYLESATKRNRCK